MMEEQNQVSDGAAAAGGGGGEPVKDEEAEHENQADQGEAAAPDSQEGDAETLPHSEILDIFEEGLAKLVQDPLLCDLPIQVGIICLLFS